MDYQTQMMIANLGRNFNAVRITEIIAVVLALAVVVVAAIVLIPLKMRGRLPGFFRVLGDFFALRLRVGKWLLQWLDTFLLVFSVLSGIFMMFTVNFFVGLAVLIFVPICKRIKHEVQMVLFDQARDVAMIRRKLCGDIPMPQPKPRAPRRAAPVYDTYGQPVQPGQPAQFYGQPVQQQQPVQQPVQQPMQQSVPQQPVQQQPKQPGTY